jgi:hypothetical protein
LISDSVPVLENPLPSPPKVFQFTKMLAEMLSTTDEELLSLVATIRTFAESISTKEWLRGTSNTEAQSIQERILVFKRLEFNARYGDYVGRLCSELAFQLVRDRDELPSVVPPEENETEDNMRTIIEALIQEWFDTSDNPNKAQAWSATKELKAYSKMMKDKEEVKIAAQERHIATAIVAKNIKEKEDAQLIEQAEAMLV